MTTALVTGANKGVGFATAKALAKAGITVWLSARSPQLGKIAAEKLAQEGLDIRFVQLDVTNEASIAAAVETIKHDGNGLDILVNNAGVMTEFLSFEPVQITLPSKLPTAELRSSFEINFFGVVAVTQAFLPLLRQSSAGRIVNVHSRLGSSTMLNGPDSPMRKMCMLGYGGSKAAMGYATIAFAHELEGTPIKVNAVSPGTVVTDLSAIAKDELSARTEYVSPDEGASIIAKYAMLPNDGPTGGFFGPGGSYPW